MTSADICCHLMKCLYHGLLSPPIFAFEFKFMSHLKRFYNEKENPFFSAFRVFCGRLFCAGAGACWHQRSHEHADLVFRSGNQTVLCHRRGAWLVGGIKTYSKFSSGDPDTSKTAASWFFACIFLIVAATILRSFFL